MRSAAARPAADRGAGTLPSSFAASCRFAGVWEDVRVRDRARLDERERPLEGVVVLAGEARDQVRPDRRVGQVLAHHREPLGGERPVVAPAHPCEHRIVCRLQRDVEVRADRR
jgi:hypothetical protein